MNVILDTISLIVGRAVTLLYIPRGRGVLLLETLSVHRVMVGQTASGEQI